jgi:ABC-type glycerol-3-phosphate transport system permease component
VSTAIPARDPRGRLRKTGPAVRIGTWLVWLFVAADILLLLWVFSSSLRGSNNLLNHPFGLPTSPKVGNYGKALSDGGFGRAALNSVFVAFVSAALVIAVASPCAYVLARRRTRTASVLTMTFVLGLGVPGQVLVIPLFIGLSKVNLTDSLYGLILVYIGLALPFTVYLLTGFFAGVPAVLEEAAVLDGAGPLRTFVTVILPVARGGIITAFLLQIINGWNETLFAIVLLHSQDKITLPVAMVNFLATEQYNGQDWGVLFAGICILLAPMLALFSWMGTRIIQGMTVGIGK